MRRNSPPAFACWLLRSVLPVPYREAMLGDLVEEYALRVESASPLTASRWFWSQTGRSVPSMILSSLRSPDWLASVGTGVVVFIAMAMLKYAAGLAIVKSTVIPQTTDIFVLKPILFLAVAAIGGCVVARVRPNATIFLALIVMISVAVLIILHLCTIPVPWWYQFGFLMLGPLAVLIAPAILVSYRAGAKQSTE